MSVDYIEKSQSLWNRAVSYDLVTAENITAYKSQSLWNRAVSYDNNNSVYTCSLFMSQSLWNRAVSYDNEVDAMNI